jgi:hypothetical protein
MDKNIFEYLLLNQVIVFACCFRKPFPGTGSPTAPSPRFSADIPCSHTRIHQRFWHASHTAKPDNPPPGPRSKQQRLYPKSVLSIDRIHMSYYLPHLYKSVKQVSEIFNKYLFAANKVNHYEPVMLRKGCRKLGGLMYLQLQLTKLNG